MESLVRPHSASMDTMYMTLKPEVVVRGCQSSLHRRRCAETIKYLQHILLYRRGLGECVGLFSCARAFKCHAHYASKWSGRGGYMVAHVYAPQATPTPNPLHSGFLTVTWF